MSSTEIYVSVDIEADGPIPGPHSMLSIGAAAFTKQKEMIATFRRNLMPLPDATQDPKTMAWWQTQPEAWVLSTSNPEPPMQVMGAFVDWLEGLPGTPLFVGWPLTYDFMFVYWYTMRFVGRSPFRHNGLDIRSYAMAMRKRDYRRSGKGYLPKRWFEDLPHTHDPLDDAIAQGVLFLNMLDENLNGRKA